jgi:long-chain acyl-CoA synthetase
VAGSIDSTGSTRRDARSTTLSAEQAALCGMGVAVAAREHPNRLAVASSHGDRSFGHLNERVNQLVRALRRRGLGVGDSVALLCSNRAEFAVAFLATLRSGMRLTPINTGLRTGEIRYIVEDCQATALLADERFASAAADAVREVHGVSVRIGIGDPLSGFEPWDEVLEAEEGHDIDDPVLGSQMPYTSGTTGRPKGVHRPPGAALHQPGLAEAIGALRYDPRSDLHLCTGPLHHAAPLVFSLAIPLGLGVPVVMMDHWDAEHALRLIASYRITHTHMVPVMFRRLLELPQDVRAAWDTSSLRVVLHGAAPCPEPVKRGIIEWLGPIVYEYYAATEGWGCLATSEEWLERPGTVGRPTPGDVEVRDLEGKSLPPGREGVVYLRVPEGGRFEYYRDEAKTRAAYAGRYFTLGDVGLLDLDGYLYLLDRSADVINTGGVNVYPAEVDAVLVAHPAVADAATVGSPDDEWGEQVVSLVELADGYVAGEALVDELMSLCERELAGFKCPRRISFEESLPRLENGKIYRRLLRDRLRGAE